MAELTARKIAVFPNKREDGEIDSDKLESFLNDVLRHVSIVKISGNEHDLLFNDAIMLAMIAQQFHNRLASICTEIVNSTQGLANEYDRYVAMAKIRELAKKFLHINDDREAEHADEQQEGSEVS